MLLNEAAERMFGYSSGELLGLNVENLVPAAMRLVKLNIVPRTQTVPERVPWELAWNWKGGGKMVRFSHVKQAHGRI